LQTANAFPSQFIFRYLKKVNEIIFLPELHSQSSRLFQLQKSADKSAFRTPIKKNQNEWDEECVVNGSAMEGMELLPSLLLNLQIPSSHISFSAQYSSANAL
jgi:hypothetical protein